MFLQREIEAEEKDFYIASQYTHDVLETMVVCYFLFNSISFKNAGLVSTKLNSVPSNGYASA